MPKLYEDNPPHVVETLQNAIDELKEMSALHKENPEAARAFAIARTNAETAFLWLAAGCANIDEKEEEKTLFEQRNKPT